MKIELTNGEWQGTIARLRNKLSLPFLFLIRGMRKFETTAAWFFHQFLVLRTQNWLRYTSLLLLVKSYGLLTTTNNSSITIGTVKYTPTAVGALSQGILTAMAADVFEPYTGGASGNCVFIDLLSTAVANHTTDNKCIVKIPAIKTNCTPGSLVVNFHTASMRSVCSLYNSDWFGWTTSCQKQNCASLLKKLWKSWDNKCSGLV